MTLGRITALVRHELGRIRARLLIVNLVVLLVPIFGLELARVNERQLLDGLERDMRNQAVLTRSLVEGDLERGVSLDAEPHARVLAKAARRTRTRIRLLDGLGAVVADSHAGGPPEGPERAPPTVLPRLPSRGAAGSWSYEPDGSAEPRWPDIPERGEVRAALEGRPGSYTRVRKREPEVLLFVTEPIRDGGHVVGAVYVVRSTVPVLHELYAIRAGLLRVLAVAVVLTFLVTLLLAWSISRPLGRLARAATRIASGEEGVPVPIGGGGEIRELAESFAVMKERLDARLRYISELSADIAHEFKSPLTGIRGAAELLEDPDLDADTRARFLKNISLDVTHLDRLVTRLLQLSRIEASREPMTIVDLEALARRVAARTRTDDVDVRVTWEASSRFLPARAADLETALANLVENAVRHSPRGETVHVRVQGGPPLRTLSLEVEDRGPGVPEEQRARLFERFFTTDTEHGTGLGLAIVRSVAEAHGGTARLASAAGEGARFVLELPLAARAAQGATGSRRAPAS